MHWNAVFQAQRRKLCYVLEELLQKTTTQAGKPDDITPASFQLLQTLTRLLQASRALQHPSRHFLRCISEGNISICTITRSWLITGQVNRGEKQYDTHTPTNQNTAGMLYLDLPTLTVSF